MVLDANEQNLLTLLVRELKFAATNYREKIIREHQSNGLSIPDDIKIQINELPSSYEFQLSELAKTIDVSNGALSKTLDETTTKMMQRVILWPLDNGGFHKEQLLGPSKYYKHEGKLILQLHPRTKQAILEETRGVSIIDLRLSLSLKGGYEKRILDMISTFKNSRDFEVDFLAFQEMVGSKTKDYSRGLSGFREAVLDKPLKRIFKSSNGVWSPTDDKKKGYELIKKGRLVKKIIFKVRYSDPDFEKDVSQLEELERNKLSRQSNIDFAELVAMEESILATEKLDTFARVMISGYQTITKENNYDVPKNVQAKIKELLG